MRSFFAPAFLLSCFIASAQIIPAKLTALIEAEKVKVIAWRRDFHQFPELSNREVNTSAKVVAHLKSLGLEVKTGIATNGVVGILKGGKPGPVMAIRADMDGLPVTERNDLPFKSIQTATYNKQQVGVMHACGHDSHMAILMGTAEVLAKFKNDLPGTIVFIFQPAEEGAPDGEAAGAQQMVKEGVLNNPKVEVIFGLHIKSDIETGTIGYRAGGTMAATNGIKIIVKGKQAHGAYPWLSVDPIVTAAQIVNNLQTIVSRNIDITENPAVVTIGTINGGIRLNIIPEQVEMLGTLRTFSKQDEAFAIERIKTIATKTAEAAGATAEVIIPYNTHYPVTFNDVALTEKMVPALMAATNGKVKIKAPATGAEDFSFYQEQVPGLFFFLGGLPAGKDPLKAPAHHTPDFFIDDSNLDVGVKAFCNLVFLYASHHKPK
ncbi:M20 family metallopeptidase [soil metagenome]